MPTLSEMFIGNIQQQNTDMGKTTSDSGAQIGAQLAHMQQEKQLQQQQLAQKQQELQAAKVEKLYGYVADAKNYMNAGDRGRYLKSAIGYRNALGIKQDTLSDEQISAFGSDENMGRIAALEGAVSRGELKLTEAAAIAANPQQFGKVIPLPPEAVQLNKIDWNEAQKAFLDRQSREKVGGERSNPFAERNVLQQHSKALTELTAPSSPLQKRIGAAQAIENSYQAFVASGGLPQEWEQFQTQLRLNQGATGGRTGVNERANAHASDLGITAQQYIQIATGKPQDVRLTSAKLVEAMKEVGKIETQQIQKQAGQALDSATAGYKQFYAKNPEQAADYYGRVDAIKQQISGAGMDSGPTTVSVGGVTYDIDKAEQIALANPKNPKSAQILAAVKKARGQ